MLALWQQGKPDGVAAKTVWELQAQQCVKTVYKSMQYFLGTLQAQHAEHSPSLTHTYTHTLIKCLLATRIYQISQAIKNS